MRDKRVILPVVYVVLLTLCVPLNFLYFELAFLVNGNSTEGGEWIAWGYLLLCGIYFILLLTLGIMNIVQSFRACARRDVHFCVRGMMIHKYGLVIFFIVNFLCAFIIFAFGGLAVIVGTRGFALLMAPFWMPWYFLIIGIVVMFTWFLLIPGGFYGVQVIRLTYGARKIRMWEAVLHGIFQFCFLADVLDAMYLAAGKWGRGKKIACVIGGLYAAVIIAGIVLIARVS